MDAKLGHEADALNFLSDIAREPYRYDFYQTMRRLECLYEGKPRWGTALRPVDEAVRLGQDPDLSFAPAPLASLDFGKDGAPPRLQVRLFGLLGPNGPLPIHLTEYARHRLRHASDPTLSRFLDVFHHRFLALFYRAWAQAQPHVNRDRKDEDHFLTYVGAFIGIAPDSLRHRDTVPDIAKLFHVGTLVRHVRDADGLAAIIRQYFRVPARLEEFVGHWLVLARRDRTYLGQESKTLGVSAVAARSGIIRASFGFISVRSHWVNMSRFYLRRVRPALARSPVPRRCASLWTGSVSISVWNSTGISGCT
jgi:type VI secretion system protein ImpH